MINRDIKKALMNTSKGILTIGLLEIPVKIDTITEKMDEPVMFEIHETASLSATDYMKFCTKKYGDPAQSFCHTDSASSMKIEKVIFNDPATIVLWSDGTKTVVKCQDGDIFDPEKGLAMAISKKAMGNKGNYCDQIKKWTEKYYDSNIVFGKVAYTSDGSKLTGKLDLNISEKLKKAVEYVVDSANKFAEATAKANKKKELTIEDKRKMLGDFCDDHICYSCPLRGPNFNCGRGFSFEPIMPGDSRIVSEEEVNKAFKIAFPEFEGGDK